MPESPVGGKKDNLSTYLRYSGMAFEFFLLCALGAFIGIKLDHWLNFSFPIFTIILILLAIFGALLRISNQVKKG
jgi:F0F1-type ATP synthase assembly protein I